MISSGSSVLSAWALELSVFGVAAGEDARYVIEHVGRGDLVIAEVLDEPALDDVDLLLRLFVDHRRDQGLELDRVFLVLEELELERAAQPIVGVPLELLALDRQRADVVHDLAPEILFAV